MMISLWPVDKRESPEWILLYFAQLAPLHQLISWSESAFLLDATIVCTHCLPIRKQNHSVLKVPPPARWIIKFTQGSLFYFNPKFFWPQNFFNQNFFNQNFVWPKKFWPQNFFDQNFFWHKNVSWADKIFGPRNNFGLKKFWITTNFGFQKILGPEKLWFLKYFWSQEIWV